MKSGGGLVSGPGLEEQQQKVSYDLPTQQQVMWALSLQPIPQPHSLAAGDIGRLTSSPSHLTGVQPATPDGSPHWQGESCHNQPRPGVLYPWRLKSHFSHLQASAGLAWAAPFWSLPGASAGLTGSSRNTRQVRQSEIAVTKPWKLNCHWKYSPQSNSGLVSTQIRVTVC